jgi:hypothetical protein
LLQGNENTGDNPMKKPTSFRIIAASISIILVMLVFSACSDMTVPEFLEINSEKVLPPTPHIIAIVPQSSSPSASYRIYWTIDSRSNETDAVTFTVSDSSQTTAPKQITEIGGHGLDDDPYWADITFGSPIPVDTPLTLSVYNTKGRSSSDYDNPVTKVVTAYVNDSGTEDGILNFCSYAI